MASQYPARCCQIPNASNSTGVSVQACARHPRADRKKGVPLPASPSAGNQRRRKQWKLVAGACRPCWGAKPKSGLKFEIVMELPVHN